MAVILSRVSRLPRTLGLPASFETHVDGFWIDKTDVTNQEFERFVRATGYAKVAERKPRAEDFPGAQPEDLVAGAVVFSPPFGNTSKEVSRARTPRDSRRETPLRMTAIQEGPFLSQGKHFLRQGRVKAAKQLPAAVMRYCLPPIS